MAEIKKYSNVHVYRQGTLLTEQNKIKITRDFGNQPVMTTARGFAGTTKGPETTRVEISNAVPNAGVEYDPGPDGGSAEPIEWTFIRGSQQMTVKLVVENDDTDGGVGSSTSLNFNLIGGPSEWKQF